MDRELQDLVASGPDNDIGRGHLILGCQPLFELEERVVGIDGGRRRKILDLADHPGACPVRVFVGCQLDDIFGIDAVFADDQFDGLARLITFNGIENCVKFHSG